MKHKTRKLPDTIGFGAMRKRMGLRFSFAGTAFLNRYADLLDTVSLTPGRVLALSFLHEHPGCEQKMLAQGLAINQASAMSLVNRLEKLGYVERRMGRDKRSNALYLTAAGETTFQESLRLEQMLTKHLFGWMTERELVRFMSTIDKVERRAGGAHVVGDRLLPVREKKRKPTSA